MGEAEFGWVYVVEIAPAGLIKIGSTGSVSDRLASHARNLGMGGGYIGMVFSAPVDQHRLAETRVLAAVRRLPGVETVEGTQEVFRGASFLEVALIVRDISSKFVRFVALERTAQLDDVQQAVVEIFAEVESDWLPTAVIQDGLALRGLVVPDSVLGQKLGSRDGRKVGSSADWDFDDGKGPRKTRGYRLEDIETAWAEAVERDFVRIDTVDHRSGSS